MLACLCPFWYRVSPSGVLRSDEFHFFFFKFRHTIKVSNSLDPEQERQYLGPNCLQWLQNVKKKRMALAGLVTCNADITSEYFHVF